MESIYECECVVAESKQSQVENRKKTDRLKHYTDNLKDMDRLATTRNEQFRPLKVYELAHYLLQQSQ